MTNFGSHVDPHIPNIEYLEAYKDIWKYFIVYDSILGIWRYMEVYGGMRELIAHMFACEVA